MKVLLLLPFFILVACSFVFAQDKVIANQQGNGNNATINQSGNDKADRTEPNENCVKALINQARRTNRIIVSTGEGNSDTLQHSTGSKLNLLTDLLLIERLIAFQSGDKNDLLLIFPGKQQTPLKFESDQSGAGNRISALASKTPSDVSLSQNGNGNSISINPCDEENSETENGNNSVSIKQSGSGNSATVSQN